MFNTDTLKDLLKSKQITQQEFADMIGKTKQTINNYFTGRTKIDIDTLIVIAKSLNVPISYFFNEDEELRSESERKQIENSALYRKDAELLKAKDEIIKHQRRMNDYYYATMTGLYFEVSNLYVDIIKQDEKFKIFLNKHRATKKLLAGINTLKVLSEEDVKLHKKFFEYIENPY